jgi:hypothetical protein
MESDLLGKDKAAQAWAKVMGELGIEYDPQAEIEALEQARTDGQLAQAQADNDALKMRMDMMGDPGDGSPQNLESTQGLNGAQIRAVLDVLEGLRLNRVPAEAALELLTAVGMDRGAAARTVQSMAAVPSTVPAALPGSSAADNGEGAEVA